MDKFSADKPIFLSPPHMGGVELDLVTEAFKTNWIAPVGPFIDRFENDFRKYLGTGHCVAVTSGTAALQLAFRVLGLERGDIVLCPTMTFVASISPALHMGAVPVFVDCADDSYNVSPEAVADAIDLLAKQGRKPRFFVAVHLYGTPCRIEEIVEVCRARDVIVIEDAAESLGASYKGKPTGTFGEFGFFSFNGNKIITTAGGGMLWANSSQYADKARYYATQAREPVAHYEHVEVGYNFRMSNVLAAIGVGQLGYLEERVRRRRAIYSRYQEFLSNEEDFYFLPEAHHSYSNRWLTTLLFKPRLGPTFRDFLISELKAIGIESRPLWKPLHMQPVFKECRYIGADNAERLFGHGVCLPSGSSLEDSVIEDISKLVIELKNIFNGKVL